ncbi:MAG: TIGR03936 family radical SAM-associated protein [Dehalococcoidia bacterium]|nr:TIGR03936 family radical SAM-associated protein [Dehalococcoidia bacterium]
MYRLRVRFRRGAELKFISHLDLMRLWIRALRRARIPLAYSEGFSPHPRISLAAPLSVGVTGESELMDITLSHPVSPHFFMNAVNQQLPHDIEVLEVYPVSPSVPSLQSQVRFAVYRVEIATSKPEEEIRADIRRLLSLEHLPWHHERDTGRRDYDLRALIDDIRPEGCGGGICILEMRLRCDESGSGRSEQVVYALGFNEYPKSIQRTQLVLGAQHMRKVPDAGNRVSNKPFPRK